MCRATFDASTSIRNLCDIEVLFLGFIEQYEKKRKCVQAMMMMVSNKFGHFTCDKSLFAHNPTAKFSLNCLKPHCCLRRRSRPLLVAAAPQSHWGDHGRWAGAEVLRQDAPHVRVQHNEANDEDSWRHVCLFVVFRHHGKDDAARFSVASPSVSPSIMEDFSVP